MPVIRLNIRWKYFLTLLALCLFPLALVTLASMVGIRGIEETVAQDTGEAFEELAQRAILQTAQTQALIFQRTAQAVEYSLLDFSKEILLDCYNSQQASQDLSIPMGRLSEKFPELEPKVLLLLDSRESMVLSGNDSEPTPLGPSQQEWGDLFLKTPPAPNIVQWTTAGFSEPDLPFQYTAYLSFGKNGKTRNLVALELNILNILDAEATAAPWKTRTHSFLIRTNNLRNDMSRNLEIMAYKKPDKWGWNDPIEEQRLHSPDTQVFQSVVDSIFRKGAGTKVLPYKGKKSLWAWAPAFGDTCFISLVPTSIVEEKAKNVASTLHAYSQSTLLLSGLTALVTLLLVTLAAFVGSRRFSMPLLEVIRGVSRVSRGDFSVRVNMETGDEWDRLIRGFNDMVPMLEETVAWRKRLELGKEVQQSLLPKAPPNVNGLDIAGRSVAAEQVGGDYYDYLKASEEHRLTVAIGDITGHGVGAALLMTTARALVRRRSRRSGNLAKIMFDINKQLGPDVADSGKFMTLFLAEVDVNKMAVRWANGGHDPAIIYDPTNNCFESLEGGGLILGPFEDSVYEQYKRPISPGHIIIMGTDGIWETMDAEGNYFGKENLKKVVAENAQLPARAIIDKILGALEKFRSPKIQEDDVTMVIIKVLELGQEYKQLKLPDFS